MNDENGFNDSAHSGFHDEDVLLDDESMASVESSTAETSLAKRETRVVSLFRVLLLVVLTLTALAVSLTALALAKDAEEADFEQTFEGHARKVSKLSLHAVFSLVFSD